MNTIKLYVFNLFTRLLPPSRALNFKVRLLRWAGAKVGKDVVLFTPKIYGNFNLVIGDDVFIGHEPLIFGANGSTIEICNHAKIGSRVVLVTGTHVFSLDGPCIEGEGTFQNVMVKTGAVVSTGSIILPGKTVGVKSHVAAGSIVTHDVPDMVRVAGNPARIIRDFKANTQFNNDTAQMQRTDMKAFTPPHCP